ncbi:MAG TPA: hypothetical protein VEH82_04025, partial [Acidimicrobiales bacterium]|nr:hypothetical protein [Acidimicrobiales bacterium]
MLGFFSFTEITDPSAHEAYNAWHQLDHLPEQFTIDGISFGQRWVRSPRCRAAEAVVAPELEPFHYMTLYLMRDEQVVPPFFALAERLRAVDRFFAARRALLSGPFEVVGRWAAPRVAVSPGAVPFRPAQGVYVVVGPEVDGAALVDHSGVAGVWQFADTAAGRTITVAFVDGDLWQVSAAIGAAELRDHASGDASPEWAGPLERVDAFRWDWFATLTP